jgi:hypothetical protein
MKPEPTYEELIHMNSMLTKQLIKALEAIVEISNKLKETKP